jgi:hypothetical protein
MKHDKPAMEKGHRAHIFDLLPDPEDFTPEDGFGNLVFTLPLQEPEIEDSSSTWDEEFSRETHQEVTSRAWHAASGRWNMELEDPLVTE